MDEAVVGGVGCVLFVVVMALALVRRRRRRVPHVVPTGRPLELILRDARRLNGSFRQPDRGRSFAKYDGTRRAYDAVLAECCAALGLAHRLDDLPDSLERDFERTRIERALQREGLGIGVSEAA